MLKTLEETPNIVPISENLGSPLIPTIYPNSINEQLEITDMEVFSPIK